MVRRRSSSNSNHFYPRPPRGGRRGGKVYRCPSGRYFYPRPPRGGRQRGAHYAKRRIEFLSTPSARRATHFCFGGPHCVVISIHALREEGDTIAPALFCARTDFYPRPPRGGRRNHGDDAAALRGFLSTPSARRATLDHIALSEDCLFLSTPSARRATAKTETKSLFSNKLYNILHEFRRALIYNGSKSYPNHAK